MIIMVSGSRDWNREGLVQRVLDRYDHTAETLIHGDAAGLDHIAARLAKKMNWEVIAFPPDKNVPSPQRYHQRNDAMLAWLPDVVLAFRRLDCENRGTDSVIRKAHAADIPVVLTEYDGSSPYLKGNSYDTLAEKGMLK